MRSAPIVPARIALDADGTPRSLTHGDVYHPSSGALAQARHVFLAGNGLPARWQGRDRFVVLETGFGLGHNALATWQAWRDDPGRCGHLVFISIEAHPPTREQLRQAPRDPSLQPLHDELVAAWPPPTFNLHRLRFDQGRVEVLLAFGDVAAWLPQIEARVDAFYLDGFAPARNPDMWQPRLFKAMARLAAPGATAATWSAARVVRDGLRTAGFAVRTAPGQGGKRDITLADWAPRPSMHTRPADKATAAARPRTVAVIGAGLAGSALAQALARIGISSVLIDAADGPATGASGNPAGLFHGVIHPDDGRHARWFRAAALALANELADPAAADVPKGRDGLLRLAPGVDLAALHALAARLGLPADYARVVDADEAAHLAGCAVASGGWLFASGGWVDAAALVKRRIAEAGAACTPMWARRVASLAPVEPTAEARWRVFDDAQQLVVEADAVVCCNGTGVADLLAGSGLALDAPLETWRGQLSGVALSSSGPAPPRVPVAGGGYAVATSGDLWFGAHSTRADDEPLPRAADRTRNEERLGLLLPDWKQAAWPASSRQDRVGWRSGSADRLPLAGPLPAEIHDHDSTSPDRLRDLPRVPGLWLLAALGSRGIASSRLAADLVTAKIAGAPLPVEADLVAAVDPGRYTRRRWRRG